jgi:DNA-binding IclR family transcriptional regulator
VLAVLGSFSRTQPVQTLSEIQQAAGLASATTHRIVSELPLHATLRRALDAICTSGYCLSRDEMTDGASSVAAPVRGATGAVIAAISVVVPTGRGTGDPGQPGRLHQVRWVTVRGDLPEYPF